MTNLKMQRVTEFMEQTKPLFREYLVWKETETEINIEIEGCYRAVRNVTFREYLMLQLIRERSEKIQTPQYGDIHEFSEFEMLN